MVAYNILKNKLESYVKVPKQLDREQLVAYMFKEHHRAITATL